MTDHERWGRESEGGIFGSDIDYEMHEAMFQDAAAAGRARYGEAPRNRHVRALLDARERRATRAEMLIFQRFIDEIPDTLRWIKKSTSERVVTVACWALGVDYFEYRATDDERVYVTDDIEQTPITGRMIAARVVDRARAIVNRLIHGEPPPSPEVRTDVGHARMWTDDWSQVLEAEDVKAAAGADFAKAGALRPYYLIERNDRGRPEWAAWENRDALTWVSDVHDADRYDWHVYAERVARGYRLARHVTFPIAVTEHLDMPAPDEADEDEGEEL